MSTQYQATKTRARPEPSEPAWAYRGAPPAASHLLFASYLSFATYFLVVAAAGAFFAAAGATGSGKITAADLMLSSSGKFLSR